MAAKKLRPHQSLPDVVWRYLVYLESRLLHDPNARELAGRVSALVGEVTSTWQGLQSSWRAAITAQALVDYINYLLDQSTVRFSRVLLSQDDIAFNTDHPRYKRYFPVS